MFYSELLSSPINAYNTKRLYGINPDNDPAGAALIGIYPVIDPPEGYSAAGYTKEGQAYRAIPHEFSDEERSSIYRIQGYGLKLEEAAEKLKGEAPVTADLPVEEEAPKPKRRRKKAD